MNKKYFSVVIFLILLIFSGCLTETKTPQPLVCYQKNCFKVEVVSDPQLMALGLQYREELAPDAGMLFVFDDSSYHAFWMKDTLIPLDMIWLDYSQRVVYMQRQAQPCKVQNCPSFIPTRKARYVLEINAGLADRMGLKEGDRLDFYAGK